MYVFIHLNLFIYIYMYTLYIYTHLYIHIWLGRRFDSNMAEFAPHTALRLIAGCTLTFDERGVHHRRLTGSATKNKTKKDGLGL